jgi:translation elongation factor EF-1beta
MTQREKEFMEKMQEDKVIPDIVESKTKEVFSMIKLENEGKTMSKKSKRSFRMAASIAASCAIITTATVGVLAATGYFEKKEVVDADKITYQFEVNYDLVPGEFEVKVNYLPEGFKEQETNKYWKDDEESWGHGISILPIYTPIELEQCKGEISEENIEDIEEIELSGMEADVITYKEAKKYQTPTNIFLFNPSEGYVLKVYGDYNVPVEELKKVADNLTIERTGDGSYETAAQKEERLLAEKEDDRMNEEIQKNRKELEEKGIPEEKLFAIGTEGRAQNDVGFTVNDFEYLDSVAGLDVSGFSNYSSVEPWLNEDGTLKPYTRQTRKVENGDKSVLLEERLTEQVFLKVNVTAHSYVNNLEDAGVGLDATLCYVKENENGALAFRNDSTEPYYYSTVPVENYELQMDGRCIWFSTPENLTGEQKTHSFFWRQMKNTEEITYDLLFVVDKDQVGEFVLDFNSFANSPDMGIEQLGGYFLLNK